MLLSDTEERISLFNAIAVFVDEEYLSKQDATEPNAKRRRIDISRHENGNGDSHGMLPPPAHAAAANKLGQQGSPGADSLLIDMANAAAKEVVLLEVKEISVSIPQRKKYDLCFTKNYLYTKQVGTTTPVQGMVYDWSQIGVFFFSPGQGWTR